MWTGITITEKSILQYLPNPFPKELTGAFFLILKIWRKCLKVPDKHIPYTKYLHPARSLPAPTGGLKKQFEPPLSLDQIEAFNFNAKAKYYTSFLYGDIF